MADADDIIENNPLLQLPTDAQEGLKQWVEAGQPEQIEDADGNRFSLSDITQLGFTRREAMAIFGIMAASGVTAWQAIQKFVGQASAATGGAGTIGTDAERPDVFADTVDSNTVTTENLNNAVIKDPSRSLADAVAQAKADEHGTVVLTPGSHDLTATDTLPIAVDTDGLQFIGAGSGADSSAPPYAGTQLIAGGGRAFEISASNRLNNLTFEGVSLNGSIHVPSGQTVSYSQFKDLIFYNADSAANSGRGLNVESGSNLFFNNDIEWIGGAYNDGATVYLNGIAQSEARHVFSYSSGGTVDGTQLYFEPQTTTISKAYTSENTSVDGMTVSRAFNSEFYAPYVELATNAFVVTGSSGATKGLRIRDGRLVPGLNGGVAITVGDQGSTNIQKGIEIQGPQIDGDTGDVVFGSNARYNLIRAFGKTGSNKWWGETIDFTFNGFQNYLEPFFYSKSGGSVDTSTLNVPYMAVEVDDGTNTTSGNPGIALHLNGTWYYHN